MEENVVLQVLLHEDGGLEIRVGNTSLSNYALIGILEQVKMNILTDTIPEPVNVSPSNQITSGKYDA